jgi:hypothetical protein
MDIIARARVQQTWASDELLDLLPEVQDEGHEEKDEEEED